MRSKSLVTGLVFLLAVAMMFSLTGAQAMPNEAADDSDTVEILIGFESTPKPATYALIRAQGWEITGELPQINVLVVTLPGLPGELPEEAADRARGALDEEFDKSPGVGTKISLVEKNGLMYAHGQITPWGVERIGAVEAHYTSTGEGIRIAILDTGIDPNHETLNVVGGYAVVNAHPPARYAEPWDDDNGHGTHVAGTAAALDNDKGVLGVAPNADLYAVKVLDRNGGGTWAGVAEGIIWAADQGIEVLNMSLGGGDSDTVLKAVEYAYGKGSLLVASAGNSGPGEGTVNYPAAYEEVIAVSATDVEDNIASWSSRGEKVELAAPGVGILSTVPNNGYERKSGTSMAAPHVAGTAALVWATDSTLSNADVRGMLQESAEDIGLDPTEQGDGLVNAAAAVGVEPPATGKIDGTVKDEDNAAIEGATVVVEGTDFSVTTGSDGSYLLEEVPTGEQEVTASADGYNSETATVTVEEDTIVTQEFTLQTIPTNTVSGTVKDSEDGALEGATVTIEETGQKATTDEHGAYSISDVEDGTYDISASQSGYSSQTQTVEVGSDKIVDFTLEETEDASGLTIDHFELTETNNPAWARVEVEWEVSEGDGNLEKVTSEMWLLDEKGERVEKVDSETSTVSGGTASGIHELRVRNGHGKTYEIILTVTDTEGNPISQTKEIEL